ncbi:MAG TPA: mandelate racemase/muconate lactonizing enzyme family protein [Prolixibacteraceae bacterium]|nr:mandelate racemase/muconate lactonizing enzyme family protein [Prolixibacteraceae bacterium]
MNTNRRKFITTSLAGGLAAALPGTVYGVEPETDMQTTYARLDEIVRQQVLKKELFTSPVVIETLELLRYKDSFLCHVRSKDGAEGWSFSNDGPMKTFYPVFINRLQPFFIGKDARNLEALLEEVYVYQSNYKFQSLALWVPVATIEFAILDLLGRIAGKSLGELIGEIHHRDVAFYQANGERDISGEEVLRHLQQQLAESKTKALKFKVGGRMSHPEFPPGRSEKLIPMIRKIFGDEMHLYADSNGSYNTEEAIRIGKLLQEYKYEIYEEPVPFDWYEETREVADALTIPVSGGEQEASLHNFKWLIAHDALQIVQPDVYYFGGMIRCMKVARMAEAMGKACTPHISDGLGYLYMMHFVSTLPNAGPFHEFKGDNKKLPLECKTSSLLIDNGVIRVPTGPGSGVDIDPDYLKKYTIVNLK